MIADGSIIGKLVNSIMHKPNYLKLPASMNYEGLKELKNYFFDISDFDDVLSVDLSSVNVIDGVGLQWLLILRFFLLNKGVTVEFMPQPLMLDKLFSMINFVAKTHICCLDNDKKLVRRNAAPRPQQSKVYDLSRVDNIIDGKKYSYRIDIRPHLHSFREGADFVPILHELQGLGECHISSFINRSLNEKDFDLYDCYLEFSVLITSPYTIDILEEVFFFVQDQWDVYIVQIES